MGNFKRKDRGWKPKGGDSWKGGSGGGGDDWKGGGGGDAGGSDGDTEYGYLAYQVTGDDPMVERAKIINALAKKMYDTEVSSENFNIIECTDNNRLFYINYKDEIDKGEGGGTLLDYAKMVSGQPSGPQSELGKKIEDFLSDYASGSEVQLKKVSAYYEPGKLDILENNMTGLPVTLLKTENAEERVEVLEKFLEAVSNSSIYAGKITIEKYKENNELLDHSGGYLIRFSTRDIVENPHEEFKTYDKSEKEYDAQITLIDDIFEGVKELLKKAPADTSSSKHAVFGAFIHDLLDTCGFSGPSQSQGGGRGR